MVNKKTNKQRIKNKKTRKTGKMGRTNNNNNKKTKGGADADFKKKLMNLDVYITEATDTDKRKIEFDVVTFHEFYDYLNETDMYLKKILTEELLAFTDPNKYEKWKENTKPIKKPYKFGYKNKDEANATKKKEEEEETITKKEEETKNKE